MRHRKLFKFISILPITWFSFEYLLANGIRPGLAISLPMLYWVGIGLRYIDVIGLKSSSLKLFGVAWFWPIHYLMYKTKLQNNQLTLTINEVACGEVRSGEFFLAIENGIKDYLVYWRQFLNVCRAAIFGILAALIISPIAIFAICLITAYFNKLYMWDLIERWRDPVEPIREMKDAYYAGKLLAITIGINLLKNEFTNNALNKLRISRGIIYTGTINLKG